LMHVVEHAGRAVSLQLALSVENGDAPTRSPDKHFDIPLAL
jgi:hypothetical protein